MARQSQLGSEQIDELLAALSQRTPAPGGGAATALAGALGAALGAMVTRYSTSESPADSARDADLTQTAARLDAARDALLALADKDAAAYRDVSRAFALPRDDPSRRQAIQTACAAACAPPADVARSAAEALRQLATRAAALNENLASDLAISADLLLAAARAGDRLVRVNAGFAQPDAEDAVEIATRALREALAAHAQLIEVADAHGAG